MPNTFGTSTRQPFGQIIQEISRIEYGYCLGELNIPFFGECGDDGIEFGIIIAGTV